MKLMMTEYAKNIWKRRFKIILLSSLIGGVFSILITTIMAHRILWNEILLNGLFGLLLGAVFSSGIQLLESLLFHNLKNLPLFLSLIIKTLSLSLMISGLYGLFFSWIIGTNEAGEILFLTETILFSLGITFFINVVSAISNLLGQKVFLRSILGTYRKPIKEDRFVMFLDIVGSTGIAEKIGDSQFLSFLKDFFEDITEPVLQT